MKEVVIKERKHDKVKGYILGYCGEKTEFETFVEKEWTDHTSYDYHDVYCGYPCYSSREYIVHNAVRYYLD